MEEFFLTEEQNSSFSVSSTTVLVLGVILASLIISASILMVGNSIGDKLAAGTTGAVVLGNTQNNQGNTADTQNPPETTIQMASLTASPAGTIGNPNASVVIVEYSDIQCPFCVRWASETYPQIKADYIDTGKVLLVHKDYTWVQAHPLADIYSNATRCAAESGKYWELHDTITAKLNALMESGSNTTAATEADLKGWITEAGLNASRSSATSTRSPRRRSTRLRCGRLRGRG
jgi:protein-disulfide isomerase